MKLKSNRTVIYMVVTDVRGDQINAWLPCKTLAQAKQERRDFKLSNHNGWNYPIVKMTTTVLYERK